MKLHLLTSFLLLSAASVSQAALVYFDGLEIPIPTNFNGVFIDIEAGTSSTSTFASADVNFFFGGDGISNDADFSAATPTAQFRRTGTSMFDPAVTSAENDIIDGTTVAFSTGFGGSGSSPNDHLGTGAGQFAVGTRNYLAFSLLLPDGGSGTTTHYGYLEVTLTDNAAGGVIHGWVYDDTPDAPVTVVPIPEPSAALLTTLALAFVAIRRRR
jgi:hypothetical protein